MIVPFDFEDASVRVMEREGMTWFALVDVCRALDIANSRNAAQRLDDDEKDDVGIMDVIGREQSTTIINESGLYSLIFTSRKPVAKRFKKWVTSEVLPAIRKTGVYDARLFEALNETDSGYQRKGMPGERFAEERKRLGFDTPREFSTATGIPLNRITNIETLHMSSRQLTFFFLLADIGFDFRYWQTGVRSIFRPISTEESALLLSWRNAPPDQQRKLLSDAGALTETGVIRPYLIMNG